MRRLLLLFALALTIAACGGDDSTTEVSSDDEPPVVDDAAPTTSEPAVDEPIPVEPDGGVGDTPLGGVPFFGGNDTICPSLTLFNDADDERAARSASQCFLDAVDADTPVVWDVSIPTIEGDPIYHRFHFTGDDIVIVRDDRADTFGSGTVQAQRCAAVTMNEFEWLPVGIECDPIDHPGFPEAEVS